MAAETIPEPDRLNDLPHPREARTLIGLEAAEQTFLSAMAAGRLHHAWLIQGQRGIGKASLAYRIARYVLKFGDRPAASLDVDPADPVARQIQAQAHPDLLVLRRPYDFQTRKLKSVITVDEVRRAPGFFSKTSSAGGWRVAILDSADEMNPAASNALLKTLEEPPERGLFLVVTHQPGTLLATLRSRCRVLNLPPLADDEIARIVKTLMPDLSPADLASAIELGQGSAGRALSLASSDALALYSEMVRLLEPLPKLDVVELHGFADRLVRGQDEGLPFRLIHELLSQWLARRIATLAAQRRPGLDRWIEVWEKTARLFERADAVNLQRKQVLLDVFMSLAAAARR